MTNFDETSRRIRWSKNEFSHSLSPEPTAVAKPPPSAAMTKTGKMLGFEITRNFPKQSPEEQRLNQQAINEVTLKAMML